MSENHHSTLPHPTLRFGGVSNGYATYTTLREDPERQPLLAQPPGSPSHMSYQKMFNLSAFSSTDHGSPIISRPKKGTFLLVYITTLVAVAPNVPNPPPDAVSGPFTTSTFLGPLVGGGTTIVAVTAAIYYFGPLTGGHMNPGGSRDFKVGGCYIFDGGSMSSDGGVSASSGLPGPVAGADVGAAFAVEFAACLAFITLAYAAALDPRNRDVIGPRLPGAEGFGGASLNPARCFGVYVGSRFPGWHWVHWLGPLAASMAHAVMQSLMPPPGTEWDDSALL
ncbi:hypothetical protein GGTG_08579 [Gaeumannomyces tritici R3-111a-1]|uniref:Aquaporin n=1 Tax=Gaeumannomyces tritici (strain R3-111a-1) TaxID=644352 RepID=J3P4Z3_GAET3|nr:hypothetical protein GGTG_08579 [Gaeumannomyces tritici R3-111a-1]EJT74741.1 hypothetical protein GGTG_08579 [Gaeumannomyces tritici R3-111a-1]